MTRCFNIFTWSNLCYLCTSRIVQKDRIPSERERKKTEEDKIERRKRMEIGELWHVYWCQSIVHQQWHKFIDNSTSINLWVALYAMDIEWMEVVGMLGWRFYARCKCHVTEFETNIISFEMEPFGKVLLINQTNNRSIQPSNATRRLNIIRGNNNNNDNRTK